jgi:hypothetical protein
MNITTAIIKKLITEFTSSPYFKITSPAASASTRVLPGSPVRFQYKLVKSILPVIKPSGGIMIPFTRISTISLNAAPMTTPIASSMALPLMAKSLNSLMILRYLLMPQLYQIVYK